MFLTTKLLRNRGNYPDPALSKRTISSSHAMPQSLAAGCHWETNWNPQQAGYGDWWWETTQMFGKMFSKMFGKMFGNVYNVRTLEQDWDLTSIGGIQITVQKGSPYMTSFKCRIDKQIKTRYIIYKTNVRNPNRESGKPGIRETGNFSRKSGIPGIFFQEIGNPGIREFSRKSRKIFKSKNSIIGVFFHDGWTL